MSFFVIWQHIFNNLSIIIIVVVMIIVILIVVVINIIMVLDCVGHLFLWIRCYYRNDTIPQNKCINLA